MILPFYYPRHADTDLAVIEPDLAEASASDWTDGTHEQSSPDVVDLIQVLTHCADTSSCQTNNTTEDHKLLNKPINKATHNKVIHSKVIHRRVMHNNHQCSNINRLPRQKVAEEVETVVSVPVLQLCAVAASLKKDAKLAQIVPNALRDAAK
ncbi:hypothetical protein EG329_007512 [Mollisiaceae sp. DMI_Dod_QoI]|nr:hypothetical protein EG329_007512 [Helotiales sp. DMI_Dod_QoI]